MLISMYFAPQDGRKIKDTIPLDASLLLKNTSKFRAKLAHLIFSNTAPLLLWFNVYSNDS